MLTGKTLLITGGSGSFGRAFTRHVLNLNPSVIRIYSRDEGKHADMRAHGFTDPRLRYLIGDVRDKERLKTAMHGVDIVIHAAALKRADALEYDCFEAVKSNVLGSQNVIESAIACGVEKVVALSSDKATSPANAYGMSKALSEKLFIAGNSYASGTKTKMSVVRYGNVIGSRGSVIPLFLEQKKTGVLTITDDRMTRFLMTLAQACEFVVSAIEDMRGGEIFVPKLPSCKITDLARAVAPDCGLLNVGIRPGEKLHEAMISEHETAIAQKNRYVILPAFHWFDRGAILGTPFQGTYSSDTNSHFLTIEEIRELIGGELEVQPTEHKCAGRCSRDEGAAI